jgi:hypothetical protein
MGALEAPDAEFTPPDEFYALKASTNNEFVMLAIHDELLVTTSEDIETYITQPIWYIYVSYNRPWIKYVIIAKRGECKNLAEIRRYVNPVYTYDLLSSDVS